MNGDYNPADWYPVAAIFDYDRYRTTLALFDADAAPATFGEWWKRYADNYEDVA